MLIVILGVLSDDEKDFVNKIFSEYHVKLYNISLRMLYSEHDAEEAVQQTFLKIIDHVEKISKLPYPQIAPYCVVIIKNTSINILRQRNKIICSDELDYLNNEVSSSIEDKIFRDFDEDTLLTAINKLSNKEKYLVHLRWSNDLSFKKIGKLLGISEETAKKRGQRVLKKLRIIYEEGEKDVQLI